MIPNTMVTPTEGIPDILRRPLLLGMGKLTHVDRYRSPASPCPPKSQELGAWRTLRIELSELQNLSRHQGKESDSVLVLL